jgi:hypothetical protein
LPFFVRQNVTTKLSHIIIPKKLPVWAGHGTKTVNDAVGDEERDRPFADGPAAKRQKTGQPAIGSDARVR